MKYLAKICLAGLAFLSLAACSHVAQYTSEDFVAFRSSSFSANESAGSIKIPVIAYPQNGNPNTSVSFKVVEKTAKSGTDFTVEPASGVLNFTGAYCNYFRVLRLLFGIPGKNDTGLCGLFHLSLLQNNSVT